MKKDALVSIMKQVVAAVVGVALEHHTSPRTTCRPPVILTQAAVAEELTGKHEPTSPGTVRIPDMTSDSRMPQSSRKQHTDQLMRMEWAAVTAHQLLMMAVAVEQVTIGELLCSVAAKPDTLSCEKCHLSRQSRNWTSVAEELLLIQPSMTSTPHRSLLDLHSCSSFPYNHVKHVPLRHSWSK